MKTNFTFAQKISYKQLLSVWVLLLSGTMAFGQTLHVVEARDTEFDPNVLEIVVGDTIEWRNVLGFHNVNGTQATYPANPESFGNEAGTGWTYQHVFTTAGDYSYQCDPHVALGMTGSISVKEDVNTLTVEFIGMNPHVGQDFYLALSDTSSGKEVARVHTTAAVTFTVEVSGIQPGSSYHVDFWADHNGNGMYDAPPTDHAWRLQLDSIRGDTTLMFAHNTSFTDIMWKNLLTVEFSGMNPHVGQNFYLALVDTVSGMEIGRMHTVADVNFTVEIPGIQTGNTYFVDFWADHNGNGRYDAPPADHAWRMELDSIMGDTTLMFAHNTSFTDIMWKNMLTVEFKGMNPHIGQMLVLYVVNANDETVLDTVTIEEVTAANFSVTSYSLTAGGSYHVNFFADFNNNDMYDAPPADHAWQLVLENVSGDTTITFSHNTNFTDIFPVTSTLQTGKPALRMYPNPASDKVWIETANLSSENYTLSVFDISGKLTKVETNTWGSRIEFNVRNLNNGIYFVEIKSASDRKTMKLIKK